MTIFAWTYDMSREEWLKLRTQGIGASDAAAVIGEHPYRSPMEVYLEKIGEMPEPTENEKMVWGNKLKNAIAQHFTESTGWKIRRRNAILRHPTHPFLLATPDRMLVGKQTGLLCKVTGEFMKDAWESGVPHYITVQCQHLMAVTKAAEWWVAVLIGGNKYRHFRVQRDDTLIKRLLTETEAFWKQNVEKRIPPPIDASAASKRLLSQMYPTGNSKTELDLPQEAESWARKYVEADHFLRLAAQRKMESENHIKAMMGTYERAKVGSYTVEWKNIQPEHTAAYRRFKVYKNS